MPKATRKCTWKFFVVSQFEDIVNMAYISGTNPIKWFSDVPIILDKIKWNDYPPSPPPPPKAMMRVPRRKNALFWHHFNGGRGGPDVSFILFRIAILDKLKWNDYSSPLPPSQCNDEGAKEQNALSVKWAEGWSGCFLYFIQDCS